MKHPKIIRWWHESNHVDHSTVYENEIRRMLAHSPVERDRKLAEVRRQQLKNAPIWKVYAELAMLVTIGVVFVWLVVG
ncbi:hypothetical protein [Neorhizobium tomejilense]|uniref:hypothetical protein n=1 Tax=Neorhizobium tomejilense TaxID=2093828 RepID=UPI003ECD0198